MLLPLQVILVHPSLISIFMYFLVFVGSCTDYYLLCYCVIFNLQTGRHLHSILTVHILYYVILRHFTLVSFMRHFKHFYEHNFHDVVDITQKTIRNQYWPISRIKPRILQKYSIADVIAEKSSCCTKKYKRRLKVKE